MARYYDKCPKCNNEDLIYYVEWDICTDQSCEKCGWHKKIGTARFYDGETFLEPSDDYEEYSEEEYTEDTVSQFQENNETDTDFDYGDIPF